MPDSTKPIVILLADDNPDDRELMRRAIERTSVANQLFTVSDGEELLDYLHRREKYAAPAAAPTPGLILLDLNMPRKDGREALAEIKADAQLRTIPVVVMTTSKAKDDVVRTYDLGTNSFITKPITFDELVGVMRVLGQYWLQVVTLPEAGGKAQG